MTEPAAPAPPPDLQGLPVLRTWRGAIYLRIPPELARPIAGGCQCEYCRQHPHQIPSWDTLGIPLEPTTPGRDQRTWTVHAPEWRVGDRIPAADRLPTPGRL